ncbi:MAG: hypothetical protein A3D95_09280 [Betaproteobacteria bacterium RIFCSPHIGHO2_12_FULL_69_13]|nr:MAG: hypothetical protein A3D95_09280 [Betaproteobacteria bacterium RIFCSPHIGHO2_12_FULL_69_13]
MLEHGQELARGQHRPFLLAHPDQHLAHRVALGALQREDRLAIQGEFVLLERLAEARDRVVPAGEPGVGLIDHLAVRLRGRAFRIHCGGIARDAYSSGRRGVR